jgi:hypothetical protein
VVAVGGAEEMLITGGGGSPSPSPSPAGPAAAALLLVVGAEKKFSKRFTDLCGQPPIPKGGCRWASDPILV